MSKLVKVINNKDRYFNWARKGWILEVDTNRVNYYLQNGFSLVKEMEVKKNIVNNDTGTLENKEFYQKELDHLGVKYNKNFWAKKLKDLLETAKKESEKEMDDDNNSDIETIKTTLVAEAIVSKEELEGKTDDEIRQIATDNWLI